ncbi:amino acid permease [Paenibacillus rigui]|uniref:Amino acid permease n=1 Tax=Paenibacillus rigui TaxID=554312 RepID=A0A229UJ39_9BACL|nr:amino acid permease [Paenibacillus rigui]OXM83400.1 amino acid permease [Paenibacillus rigui]
MKWWQLSLLGVACTIGTGYFLGSAIAIQIGGGSVVFLFIVAAIGTYVVFDALSAMTADDPQQGSFRAYAKKAFGRWAGFSSGWMYWSSEMMIMGSQLTALSLFTRQWFPAAPMWLLATGYAVLALAVMLAGTKGFERLEHLFAVMKVSAILMFVILAMAALFGWIPRAGGAYDQPHAPFTADILWPGGMMGSWSSLIYAFYAFGGIEIMGLLATRLKRPEEAPRAGKVMILSLTTIYIASLVLALTLVPLAALQVKESPFQVTLNQYQLPWVPHIFNAILIVAGFSTMIASLFAVTTILVTLAEDHDAPTFLAKKSKGKKRVPYAAIGLTTTGMAVSVLMALLLPEALYEYVTTAAGIMLLYNWLFILVTSRKLLQRSVWGSVSCYLGMGLIAAAVTGTCFHATSRPGFWISLLFMGGIGLVTLAMRPKWNQRSPKRPQEKMILFKPRHASSQLHKRKNKDPLR